ncbi:hypothetical protein ACJX0J_039183, partial [Zea mays]
MINYFDENCYAPQRERGTLKTSKFIGQKGRLGTATRHTDIYLLGLGKLKPVCNHIDIIAKEDDLYSSSKCLRRACIKKRCNE